MPRPNKLGIRRRSCGRRRTAAYDAERRGRAGLAGTHCDVAPKRLSDALRIVSPNLWSNRSNASDFAKALAERVSPTYMTFSCGAGPSNHCIPQAGAGPVSCNGLLGGSALVSGASPAARVLEVAVERDGRGHLAPMFVPCAKGSTVVIRVYRRALREVLPSVEVCGPIPCSGYSLRTADRRESDA